jgi:hypothetical protein
MTRHFNISRFGLLMKMELFRSRNAVVMTFVIAFGLLFFIGFLLDAAVEPRPVFDSHHSNYASSLLIGGFILSSLAFNDLGNTLKRYQYLTLPASTFEKFLSMWLLTSFGWIISFTLIYTMYTFLVNSLGPILFDKMTFPAFEPFSEFPINSMRAYFVLQGAFLVGAAHFRGYAFAKTLLVLILVAAVIGALVFFTLKGAFLSEHECSGDDCELVDQVEAHGFWLLLQWLFWWALAPLFWLTAYLGLKDQEA